MAASSSCRRPEVSDQEAQRNPTKRKKAQLSAKETIRVLAQVYDCYGIDRSPGRDLNQDGFWAEFVLYLAARDGLLRAPGKPPGRKAKVGNELVRDVVFTQLREGPRLRGRAMRPKLISVDAAIKIVQEQDKDNWGRYDPDDLKRRFYDAKKAGRRRLSEARTAGRRRWRRRLVRKSTE
jgi:hypothetical protein